MRARTLPCLLLPALLALAAPALARDSLGVFGQWGAFRDAEVPRCYAIALAENEGAAYATVSHWPGQQVRGQVHVRLSRPVQSATQARLAIGAERFELSASGSNAFAADQRMDAQVVAAMRAAGSMTISARDRQGRLFTDSYSLDGAATAIDAATVGCARGG